jgi:flavin reductase (DIM6/NTAB) family NADH-FMN oxidoreductase RutF/rubredoxin
MDASALGKLSYGLYIVGVKTKKGFGGCVLSMVGQVDFGDKPRVRLVCHKDTYTTECLKENGECTLSVLPDDINPAVISLFGQQSARNVDKWAQVPYTVKDGLPVLDKCCSFLRLKVESCQELDTRFVFLCQVCDAWNGTNPAKPLIYGDYKATMETAKTVVKSFVQNLAKAASGMQQAGVPCDPADDPPDDPPAPAKWRCKICGYIYDESAPGAVPFAQLPADWKCPLCGEGKEVFERVDRI